MSSAGWYVVKFINEENLIEVIPSNWIINFEKCFWPTKLGLLKLQLAIKNSLTPNSDWSTFDIEVICNRMFTNFKDASKYAHRVLAESSSETDQIIPTISYNLKRKNKENKNNESSSDEEPHSADNIPKFPSCK